MRSRITATVALSLVWINQAMAGWFVVTPNNPPPTPVPEFDGSSGVAAVALLASLVAILLNRLRAKA